MTRAAGQNRGGFVLDAEGWVLGARQVPSPNFDERSSEGKVELVVVHAISLPPNEFGDGDVDRLFTNSLDSAAHPFFAEIAGLRVSAHFLITRDGQLTQYVSCLKRAWHAGVSSWRGRERCNDFSLGIELEGCDTLPFSECQYATLSRLLELLRDVFPVAEILGHADIAPGRKTDPGPFFDWRRSALRP